MSFALETLPDDIQDLVAVLVALGLAEAFDGEEFLFGRGGEVGYGQEGFLVEDDVGGDVVFLVFFTPPVHKGLGQFRMDAASVGGRFSIRFPNLSKGRRFDRLTNRIWALSLLNRLLGCRSLLRCGNQRPDQCL